MGKKKMEFEPASMASRDAYLWMTRLINPRPIAWVSSLSKEGVANLAPFSFFNAVGSRPPTLVFCPANKRDGSPKDTLLNVQQTGEFVVNVVTMPLAEQMYRTADELSPETDEFEFASLEKQSCSKVKVPRVAKALAAFECELLQVLSLAAGPGAANMVIGRIVHFHVADVLFDKDGEFDSEALTTIGRMGDREYTRTVQRFTM